MQIKLSFLLILSVIIFVNQSYSQIEIKPAIGINFTGFSEDPVNGTSSAQLGWQLGGTVSFGDKFYGEGGIFWTYKANDISETDTNITLSTSLSGIRIPIVVGYHILGSETDFLSLRAFGGGSITVISNVDVEGLSKSDFTSPSYGVFLGAGVDLSLFFLDLKYEWSLSDVSDISSFDVGKARTIFINAGVRLTL